VVRGVFARSVMLILQLAFQIEPKMPAAPPAMYSQKCDLRQLSVLHKEGKKENRERNEKQGKIGKI